MKRLMAGLISSVFFAGMFLGAGTAIADDDDHYEYGERYEHGRYYNPYYNNGSVGLYGNGYYNNGYRNHERYEYDDDDYRYRGAVSNGYVNPYYTGNGGYRNHEAYEHRGYRR